VQAFAGLSPAAQMDALDETLDACLQTDFWRGKNGVLWRLAHPKVRPVGSIKSGEDPGSVPLIDYYPDYHLFVWTQIDNHDARDLLLGDYYVERSGADPTVYTRVQDLDGQNAQIDRRAGMVTTAWFLDFTGIMFTALPRTGAALAFRAYLGLDMARLEGLDPVENEPVDYDATGVQEPGCAVCHSTLDPLAYPFSTYKGIDMLQGPFGVYMPDRIEQNFPEIGFMPEQGVIFGQPVNDLMEWVQIAANSDDFAKKSVEDYWMLMVGRDPNNPVDRAEYEALWKKFKGEHAYGIERMLHDLIRTEAYGDR
jgi:hypothetical protein